MKDDVTIAKKSAYLSNDLPQSLTGNNFYRIYMMHEVLNDSWDTSNNILLLTSSVSLTVFWALSKSQ